MSEPDDKTRFTHWAALVAIIFLGAVMRHERIGADSISLDEMWHLGLSTGGGSPQMIWPVNEVISVERSWTEIDGAPPWYACWTGMERVLHPPLFVMTLRIWREAFASGDIAAQWYTAAWSLAAIALTFAIVRTLTRSATAGLWAAAILAVSPTQILLSQELRAYSMLTGLTCCAMLAAVRIEAHGVTLRRAIALGLCMLAMMLTHYFAIGLCAMIALWACIRFRGRDLAMLWSAFTAAGVIFAVAWLPIATRQIPDIGHTADPWLKELAPHPFLLAVGRFFAMPIRLLVDQEYSGLLWPAAAAVFLAFAIWRTATRRELLLPLLWFAGVCGFLLILDLARVTRHLVHIRYSLAASPAIAASLILLCRPAQSHRASGGIRGVAMPVVGTLVLLALIFTNDRAYFEDEPDYRLLRKFMLERAGPREPMLFYSGPAVKGYFNEILMLAASREPTLWPRRIVKLAEPADAPLVASLGGGTAWLFSGPVDDYGALLPGCEVLSSQVVVDQQERPVAVCTHVRLP